MTQPYDENDDSLLDLEGNPVASSEQIESEVQKAQEQLLQLNRQREAIERQKRELEELSRKQNELEVGRTEMNDKLSRALTILEREIYESQKRVEQLLSTRESFAKHLDIIESINPASWSHANLAKELGKALIAVEDAKTEYSKCRSRINAESGEDLIDADNAEYEYERPEKDFFYWLKSGFAFTLPVVIVGLLILIFLFAKF